MTHVRMLRSLGSLSTALGFVLVLTACPEDAVDTVRPVATSLDFAVAPTGSGFPVGVLSLNRFVLTDFDTTFTDAFSRATDDLPGFDEDTWIYGPPMSRDQDPRAPTLTATGTPGTTADGFLVGAPASEGEGHYFFIVSGALTGLPASTTYTVALVRYGLQINAELDASAILLGEPITQKDSLIVIGPNPLGNPAVVLGTGTTPTNRGDSIFAEAGANPFIIGSGSTTAGGNTDFGIVIRAETITGAGVFFAGTDAPPTEAQRDSAMFGRNDDVSYDLPRYNYLVLFEGLGVTGAPIARWQLAQDLLVTGEPINNAHWPLPQSALTTRELVEAAAGRGGPDSVTLVLSNLDALADGVYQIWLSNRDEAPVTMIPRTGTYEKIEITEFINPLTGEVDSVRKTVVETIAGTSTFAGEVGLFEHRITLNDVGAAAADSLRLFTDVFLTLESQPGDATAAESRVLWFQYEDQKGTPQNLFDDAYSSGTILFGHFDPANPSASSTFTAANLTQSSGLGGVRDEEVTVEIRNLPLPPRGMYYEGWLVGENGTAVSMGPIMTLPPDTVSLFDADEDQTLPGVTETGIRFAYVRVLLPSASSIVDMGLSQFLLTLEPKIGAASRGPTGIEIGTLPVDALVGR